MKVQRITIDADLGIIQLKTGPGGDGNYVLLPIVLSEEFRRYIDYDRMADAKEGPKEDDVLIAAGPLPSEGMPEHFNYPKILRGGIKYPVVHEDKKWTTDNGNWEEPETGPGRTEGGGHSETPHGAIGDLGNTTPEPARKTPEWQKDNPVHFAQHEEDQASYDKTEEKRLEVDSPVTGQYLPNPVMVFALYLSGGYYSLTSPSLPDWVLEIEDNELASVPHLAKEALLERGYATEDVSIAIVLKD
jgi:hypothetical protein